MSAREDCVAADADWPEPTATLELTTAEARWLLQVLKTHIYPRQDKPMEAYMTSRVECAIEIAQTPVER